MSIDEQVQISDTAIAKIEKWLKKFPEDKRQSAVIPALHIVQDENNGWLSEPLLEAVADYLGMPKIKVFEVATFYNMFDLKPVGCHKIGVCNSISCHLMGSEDVLEHLEKKLQVQPGDTTKDGKFTLKEVECLGACRNGPVMFLDKQYHEELTVEKVDKIIDGLKDK